MVSTYVYILVALSSFLLTILIVGLINLIRNRMKKDSQKEILVFPGNSISDDQNLAKYTIDDENQNTSTTDELS